MNIIEHVTPEDYWKDQHETVHAKTGSPVWYCPQCFDACKQKLNGESTEASMIDLYTTLIDLLVCVKDNAERSRILKLVDHAEDCIDKVKYLFSL